MVETIKYIPIHHSVHRAAVKTEKIGCPWFLSLLGLLALAGLITWLAIAASDHTHKERKTITTTKTDIVDVRKRTVVGRTILTNSGTTYTGPISTINTALTTNTDGFKPLYHPVPVHPIYNSGQPFYHPYQQPILPTITNKVI